MSKRYYIAGPMRGRRGFNFPNFLATGQRVRLMGHEIFNPAEHDIEKHGEQIYRDKDGNLLQGNLDEIAHLGFDLRHTLGIDTAWICENADGIVVLPGWDRSSGAKAEVALALALGLDILRVDYGPDGWFLDPVPAQIHAAS